MTAYHFVFGVPKSGTTWLQHLLDNHPNVVCRGEAGMHFFGSGLYRLAKEYSKFLTDNTQKIFGEQLMPELRREEFQGLMRCFIEQRLWLDQSRDGVLSIGNKEPDHGQRLAVMGDVFPQALYIHLVRDGRDCTVSYWHHVRRTYGEGFPNASDFRKFAVANAEKWTKYIRGARQDANRLRLRYVEVRYEDLKQKPVPTMQRLFQELGVDSGEDTVARCIEAASFEKLSGGRTTGQEDNAAFYRKGVSGDWRNYFDDALVREFGAGTRGLAQELGYA